MGANADELRELLPKLGKNKAFIRRQQFHKKKKAAAREAELVRLHVKKAKKSPTSTSKTEKAKNGKKTVAKKGKKKSSGSTEKTRTATGEKKRQPKLVMGQMETGKETLAKKKARELVALKKKSKKDTKKSVAPATSASRTGKGKKIHVSDAASNGAKVKAPSKAAKKATKKTTKKSKKAEVEVEWEDAGDDFSDDDMSSMSEQEARTAEVPLSAEERDAALLARAIRGNGSAEEEVPSDFFLSGAKDGLYPNLPFISDYAERKRSESVSADDVLLNANAYFKKLNKQEQTLHKVAKEHIQHMREVNRRGGDKDGFRYVVPSNVRQVMRDLLAKQKQRDGGRSAVDDELHVDTEGLVSTFGGDGLKETEAIPVRRRRRRSRVSDNFYQHQVSKKWTANAEKFLRRSRPNKSLFEAKKHQRSVKKF